ncbi:MAG: hypothetical protein N2235_25960 [Fischerella sp.]|nr:hypothetical protein [Fischerella sp.]
MKSVAAGIGILSLNGKPSFNLPMKLPTKICRQYGIVHLAVFTKLSLFAMMLNFYNFGRAKIRLTEFFLESARWMKFYLANFQTFIFLLNLVDRGEKSILLSRWK